MVLEPSQRSLIHRGCGWEVGEYRRLRELKHFFGDVIQHETKPPTDRDHTRLVLQRARTEQIFKAATRSGLKTSRRAQRLSDPPRARPGLVTVGLRYPHVVPVRRVVAAHIDVAEFCSIAIGQHQPVD